MLARNRLKAADIIDLSSQNNSSTSKPVTFRTKKKKKKLYSIDIYYIEKNVFLYYVHGNQAHPPPIFIAVKQKF